MDPTGNFNAYRSCLLSAVSSTAQDKQQVSKQQSMLTLFIVHTMHFIQTSCVIPVFSLLLKDIYFLNQGNKNKLRVFVRYHCNQLTCYLIRCPNGLINFEKFWALSRLITQILSFRNANVRSNCMASVNISNCGISIHRRG